MKSGRIRIVLQVNTHRLTESDFLIWRHAFKMVGGFDVRLSLMHMQSYEPAAR